MRLVTTLIVHVLVLICYLYAVDRVGLVNTAVTVRYVTIVQKVRLDSAMQLMTVHTMHVFYAGDRVGLVDNAVTDR
jgi:hypothetical protein